MSPVIRGRAGDDAVVIVRVALGFHQSLASAVRAGVEIGALWRGAIERPDDGLGVYRCFVDGAMPEIDDLLRMVEGPFGGLAAVLMACIGGGRCVAVTH